MKVGDDPELPEEENACIKTAVSFSAPTRREFAAEKRTSSRYHNLASNRLIWLWLFESVREIEAEAAHSLSVPSVATV